MSGVLVVGLLFLAAAVYNVLGPEPNLAEAAAGGAIAALLVGVFFAARGHARNAEAFASWLASNADAIK
jgi:hypothetical protein